MKSKIGTKVSLLRKGDDKKLNNIIKDYENGKLGGIIMSGVNPVYSLPETMDFKSLLSNVDFFSKFFNEDG